MIVYLIYCQNYLIIANIKGWIFSLYKQMNSVSFFPLRYFNAYLCSHRNKFPEGSFQHHGVGQVDKVDGH